MAQAMHSLRAEAAVMRRILIATILIAGTAVAGIDRRIERQENGWYALATRTADGATRRSIDVGRPAGHFHVVQIKAKRGVPRITRVRIDFTDGQHQDVDVFQQLEPRHPSAVIDLVGGARFIDRVIVETDRVSTGEFAVSAG
jgi:hypothetical protein